MTDRHSFWAETVATHCDTPNIQFEQGICISGASMRVPRKALKGKSAALAFRAETVATHCDTPNIQFEQGNYISGASMWVPRKAGKGQSAAVAFLSCEHGAAEAQRGNRDTLLQYTYALYTPHFT